MRQDFRRLHTEALVGGPAGSYNERVACTLREFQPKDFETLWSIDQQCFPRDIAYSRAELTAYLIRPGVVRLVAECRGSKGGGQSETRIAGFVVAEASRGIGHIITIDVPPEFRRLRVGSLLLDEAEDRLRAANCRAVFLETAVDNTAALAFYKRHEYFLVKTVPRYYSNGVDAFLLRKNLLSRASAS